MQSTLQNLIQYEILSKKSFVLYGQCDEYANEIRSIKGHWNKRLKTGPAWVIPRDKEEQLQILVKQMNETVNHNTTNKEEDENVSYNVDEDNEDNEDDEDENNNSQEETDTKSNVLCSMKTHAKERKTQHKYHRAISDDEESDIEKDNPVLQYFKSYAKCKSDRSKSRSSSQYSSSASLCCDE